MFPDQGFNFTIEELVNKLLFFEISKSKDHKVLW